MTKPLAPQLADPQPGPEAVVDARQQWALVKEALDELPVQRRKVLWMMRVEGKSQKEVAAELGLSPKTVENHMTLALKSLMDLLKRSRP
ncbi:MAG: sigma-70 family RNA polymerase sigma factor [Ahniella sp.]|nr:sigma-70 family RNA polymerase sigma factor [Ahniella sp.]